MTVLIIDDDQRNIFALTAVLKARGISVLSATAAREGIALLRNHTGIKVVLMDVMMPEMDGYEAIALIRSYPELHAIPVFAVTAKAMVGDRERALEAGAAAYISKPIDVDLLVALLAQYQ